MNHDPNWFYSSLAQCAAAIVGLLGAFLAVRLHEQYANARSTYGTVANQLKQLRQEFQKRLADVEAFASFADQRIQALKTALVEKKGEITVSEELEFWGSRRAGKRWLFDVSKENLDRYIQRRQLVEPTIVVLKPLTMLRSCEDLQLIEQAIARLVAMLPVELHSSFENWRSLMQTVDNANEFHLRNVDIKVPTSVTIILGWLCVFGLVAPLAYLSAYEEGSKLRLLVAFSVGVLAIPIYVAFELIQIYRLKAVKIDAEA